MEGFDRALTWMDSMHLRLSGLVPPPQPTSFGGNGWVFRYANQDVYSALIQKLARVVTGLRAARLLAGEGLFQEQASMQRILDELTEDIMFLAMGTVIGPMPPDQAAYLRNFYLEEWADPESPASSQIARPMPDRKKIHAYITRQTGTQDPSTLVANQRVIQKSYSGFVHAASPQIMDLYGGLPPGWHLRTMLGTPIEQDHKEDLWSVFYRGLCSFSIVTSVFSKALNLEATDYVQRFAAAAGKTFAHPSSSSAPE